MKHIAIAGVSGFVGQGLAAMCKERGIEVTGISRKGTGNVDGVARWQTPNTMDFRGLDAVINLAGEPVDQRWTAERKKSFEVSRVAYTRDVVAAIAACNANERPRTLVNASAVGIYASRGDELLDESAPAGSGFLADLCKRWEQAAAEGEAHGVRVAMIRTGLVLGRDGKAWQKLRLLFRLGFGGRLSHGRQWMPWIHVHDLRNAILHAAATDSMRGPFNGAAPGALRNVEFTRQLAASLHRPAFFPAPAFALRLALGEFASVLLASQRVIPAALESAGFTFRYPSLSAALEDLNKSSADARSDER